MRFDSIISTHTIRADGNAIYKDNADTIIGFQSTPSVRMETSLSDLQYADGLRFNPHHPCEWRPFPSSGPSYRGTSFNPHHPCGWRLCLIVQLRGRCPISIRAIHKGQRPFYFAIRSSLICEVLSRVTASKAVTLALISSTFSATWSSFWNFSFMPC